MARDVYDALWDRWRQLLFTDTEAAEDMQARIAALQRAGDQAAALRYAREVCPWLDPAARRAAPLLPPPPVPAPKITDSGADVLLFSLSVCYVFCFFLW
jgi:hypothetical protein